MKRLLCILAMFGMAASLFGIKAQNLKPEKMLIVYYSWSGNTRTVAEIIQKATGATLFELKTKNAYPEDYQQLLAVAKKEIENKSYPALQTMPSNLNNYDVIFVGTPNWYGTMAPAMSEFFAKAKINDKIVIPFVTHGRGGMQNCEKDMQNACPTAMFLKGFATAGKEAANAEAEVLKWLREIGMAL